MLRVGREIFIQIPSTSSDRELHRGETVEVLGERVAVELDEAELALRAGLGIFLYYDEARRLMQQAATIAEVGAQKHEELGLSVTLQTRGEPIPAERRQYPRVACSGAGVTARIDDENDCPVHDVSVSGIGLIAKRSLAVATQVETVLRYRGMECRGRACIQNLRMLAPGQIRYGLRALDPSGEAGFRDGLQEITMAVQRDQVSRLANS